jgi:NADH-quinone oxidoreductase E subunit
MSVRFDDGTLREYEAIVAKYPSKRAAIMPVLWLAQEKFGWLSVDVQQYVADLMGFPIAWVSGVASFYTMYYKKPVGRHHVQVCTNVSCLLRGADEIVECIAERLGIGLGETTPDKKFTLDEVECLGSCDTAPMMQVNDDYHENLDPRSTLELIEQLGRD